MQHLNFIFRLVPALALALAVMASPTTAQETAREGIHVQGDWVIEVRNADGELADRREFSNALVSPQMIAWALSEGGSASIYAIQLTNCWEDAGAAVPCYVNVTTNQPADGTIAEAGNNPVTLVLSGSLTVALPTIGTTNVAEVATFAVVCQSNTTCTGEVGQDPSSSGSGVLGSTSRAATATTLASPVEIADGQTVSVTVTISFS